MSEQQVKDRRRVQRKQFRIDRGGVEFSVVLDGEKHPIHVVHDVSITGIRLGVLRQVAPDESLRLISREEDFVIEVNGQVRWCRDAEEGGGYEAGVEFDNSDVDNNILFFMSLRKYLDSFDDIPEKEAL